MGYKKANNVLPHFLLCAVQQYIDGEYMYIPRKVEKKKTWGANTGAKQALLIRNKEILAKYRSGYPVEQLAEQYFLSAKTIYKIINLAKKQ